MPMLADRFAHPGYLVETDRLARELDDPALRIFDCTAFLIPDPERIYRIETGEADWRTGHIPGAGFIDIQGRLSEPHPSLRFTWPTAERFAEAMGAYGVGEGTRVVLYATGNPNWATRVWWMLRAFGFEDVAVLNGGLPKWRAEGRPLSTEPCRYPPARFVARPRAGFVAGRDDVRAAMTDSSATVLNALSAEQHRGSGGTHYGRPGRIPGSVNVPAASLVDPATNAWRPPAELAAAFRAAGVEDGKRVVCYCGGGIAASNTAFVLSLLGHDAVTLYDNSLSEWAADPSLPMETG